MYSFKTDQYNTIQYRNQNNNMYNIETNIPRNMTLKQYPNYPKTTIQNPKSKNNNTLSNQILKLNQKNGNSKKKQKNKSKKIKILIIIIAENQYEDFQQFSRNLQQKSYYSKLNLAEIVIVDSYQEFLELQKRQDEQYYILSSQKAIKQIQDIYSIKQNWVVFLGDQKGSKKQILNIPTIVYYTKRLKDLQNKLQSRGFINIKQFQSIQIDKKQPIKVDKVDIVDKKQPVKRKIPSISIAPAQIYISNSQNALGQDALRRSKSKYQKYQNSFKNSNMKQLQKNKIIDQIINKQPSSIINNTQNLENNSNEKHPQINIHFINSLSSQAANSTSKSNKSDKNSFKSTLTNKINEYFQNKQINEKRQKQNKQENVSIIPNFSHQNNQKNPQIKKQDNYYVSNLNNAYPLKSNDQINQKQNISSNDKNNYKNENEPIGPGSNRIIDLREYDKYLQNGVKVYRKRTPQRVYYRDPEEEYQNHPTPVYQQKDYVQQNRNKSHKSPKKPIQLQNHNPSAQIKHIVNPYLATLDQQNVYHNTFKQKQVKHFNTYDYGNIYAQCYQKQPITKPISQNNPSPKQQYNLLVFPQRKQQDQNQNKKVRRIKKKNSEEMKNYLDQISSVHYNNGFSASGEYNFGNNKGSLRQKQQKIKEKEIRDNLSERGYLSRTKIDDLKESQLKRQEQKFKFYQQQQNKNKQNSVKSKTQSIKLSTTNKYKSPSRKLFFASNYQKLNKLTSRSHKNDTQPNHNISQPLQNLINQYKQIQTNSSSSFHQSQPQQRYRSPQYTKHQPLLSKSKSKLKLISQRISRPFQKSMEKIKSNKNSSQVSQKQSSSNEYMIQNTANNNSNNKSIALSRKQKPQFSTIQTYYEYFNQLPSSQTNNFANNSIQTNLPQLSSINYQQILQQSSILYLVDHINSQPLITNLQNQITINDSIYKYKTISQLYNQIKQSVDVYDYIFVFQQQVISKKQKELFYASFPWCYFIRMYQYVQQEHKFVINVNEVKLKDFKYLKDLQMEIVECYQRRKQLQKSIRRIKENVNKNKKQAHSQVEYFTKSQSLHNSINKRLVNSLTDKAKLTYK